MKKKTVIKFSSRYTEYETLGEGTSAVVKRCTSKLTGKEFAVKIIRTDDLELTQVFKKEYQVLKKLNHINIVKVYDLFVDPARGKIHIVMELIKGKHMFDAISEIGTYTESVAKCLFKQLLEATRYLHENGICHRDIKPNNIMIDEEGYIAKLTDFNVSKRVGKKKVFDKLSPFDFKMMTPTGTMAFSAPELLSGETYSECVDLWSCGTVLFTMLGGHQPFMSRNVARLVKSITKAEYNFEEEEWKCISDLAKDLVTNLLKVEPSLRLTAFEALNHPWLKTIKGKSFDILEASVKRIGRAITNRRDSLVKKHSDTLIVKPFMVNLITEKNSSTEDLFNFKKLSSVEAEAFTNEMIDFL